jgi:undecaprenyl-diphosphatase
LPGDVGSVLDLQRLLLPHKTLTLWLEQVSTVTWPIPALETIIASVALLLLLRRWLDALLVAALTALGSGSSFLTSLLIQRPRPTGHGIYVLWQIKDYWSFPSGHVEHALTFFGILLFLTYQIPRPAPWLRPVLWAVRLGLLAFIVLMAPSRLVEGQHWTSDVVQGYLYGAFWLILGIHAYRWAAQRWPRLLAAGERERKRVAYAT